MSPCAEQIERTMKKSKAREWTVWELAERTEYAYSTVSLSLRYLVKHGIVQKRPLVADGRLGRPGYGYWLAKKKVR